MAAGHKIQMAVTTQVDGVMLELTMEEAQFLADVMYKVGGNPRASRRRHQAPISDALRAAGMRVSETRVLDMSGNIFFNDDKKEE